MTADVVQMHPEEKRAEAAEIAERRQDAIRQHPSYRGQCPPHAAQLHRLASFITTEDLPPARITITPERQVHVDLTGSGLVENGVRRWAAALDMEPVTETEVDSPEGYAARQWSTSGYDGTGTWWHVTGLVLHPVSSHDGFGVGLVHG